MGVNSLPKTVARQRRDCDLNPDPPAPESSTLTTRLPSHLHVIIWNNQLITILLQQWSSTQKQVLASFENVRKIFASRVCGTRPPGPLWGHHWIQRTVREDSIGSGPVSSGRCRSSSAWPARHLSILLLSARIAQMRPVATHVWRSVVCACVSLCLQASMLCT